MASAYHQMEYLFPANADQAFPGPNRTSVEVNPHFLSKFGPDVVRIARGNDRQFIILSQLFFFC